MKLLVTGANGFIGKAFITHMHRKHDIIGLVRDSGKCQNLSNVEFINHDFSNRLNNSILPKKIDAIIHLAQSNQYRNFPVGMRDMADVNISGLVDILEYARTADCKNFINFSSGSVYLGDPNAQSEDSPINPISAYPLTKYIAEQVTDLYSDFFTTLNIRLFFPYGPGQQNMLIPNIINSVKNSKPIGLQGNDGGLKLCPIYIDDVVSICAKCLEKNTRGLMNVGGTEALTLQQIANQITQVVGLQAIFEIDNDSTPAEFAPTLERMESLLDGQILTAFSDGIRSTITTK